MKNTLLQPFTSRLTKKTKCVKIRENEEQKVVLKCYLTFSEARTQLLIEFLELSEEEGGREERAENGGTGTVKLGLHTVDELKSCQNHISTLSGHSLGGANFELCCSGPQSPSQDWFIINWCFCTFQFGLNGCR